MNGTMKIVFLFKDLKVGLNNKLLKLLNYMYTCGREYMSGNDATG